ncbi:alginate O-acetyltransferase AlgX-related protein [Formosa sp. S-31]|uniref:alginate O-acetyltransferase AlgX-related protein n=1 Tax=Formosa sp. S-31 TaxID=2790949 RepID=UPI003EB707A6
MQKQFKILITLFVLVLLLPNIVMILGIEKENNNENRKFKSLPEFNISTPKKSIKDLKQYYEENYGLKQSFVNTYIAIKNNFNSFPIPNRVVKGTNNWYFLGNDFNNYLNDTFGNSPFTNRELDLITEKIKTYQTYLNSKNIAFFLVVPPNKSSIYKNQLPYSLSLNNTKLDQLIFHLKKEINFDIIDLRTFLISNAKDNLLYLKSDTHWNEYGAYLGYKKTMETIKEHFDLNLAKLDEFHLEQIKAQGDITAMINDSELEVTNIYTSKNKNIKAYHQDTHYVKFKNPNTKLKLLMYHDSFSYAWMNYFNYSFGESIYIHDNKLNKTIIEKTKPDIVILEIVERNLIHLTD